MAICKRKDYSCSLSGQTQLLSLSPSSAQVCMALLLFRLYKINGKNHCICNFAMAGQLTTGEALHRVLECNIVAASRHGGNESIILNMGLIEVPTLEGYWTIAWESEIPFFGG